jgi:hypothetical protein
MIHGIHDPYNLQGRYETVKPFPATGGFTSAFSGECGNHKSHGSSLGLGNSSRAPKKVFRLNDRLGERFWLSVPKRRVCLPRG